MASGVNADQNFYSRRPQVQTAEQQHQNVYEPPPLPAFEGSRSPQLPPKLPFLTSENLKAAASNANGFQARGLTNGGDRDRDPDDFYREYRGVQTSTGFANFSSSDMAATDSRPPPSSLRSNGNGTTPKHPSLSQRTAGKPSYRSASAPLDDRLGTSNTRSTSALNNYGTSRQPSVKDLLKRFDQNNEQPTSTYRKPAPRINTKDVGPGFAKDRVGYQARNTPGQNTGVPSRVGANGLPEKKSPPSMRNTQRARFAAEDQHSNNTLSGTARTTRVRNSVSGNISQASKSMINLSPTSPDAPSHGQTRRPLFGEVLPVEQGILDIGYGIPHTATRRTSDSGLHPTWSHRRSKSDLDVSPSSPTAWYLGATALDDVDPHKGARQPSRPPRHNRAHSDFADTKVNTMNGVSPTFQNTHSPTSSINQPSRLPIQKNRLSSSSESSLQSRANSPFAAKTLSNGKLRKPDQRPWSPVGRSITPTNRAKTPTHSSPRGKARSAEKSTSNNASLKAYISAPPPKLSPPLRSSRPRQPVSSASTASSKQKTGERSGSPQHFRTGMKITRNNAEAKDKRERQIPDLPLSQVDFVARREKIRRAYTKSIDEREQKEIRAANLRRLTERQNAINSATLPEANASKDDVPGHVEVPPIPEILPEAKPEAPPLQITTSFYNAAHRDLQGYNQPAFEDSPTLGMPGSFVDDDECPPSAISNATGITEIDNEPQTEAARVSRRPSAGSPLSSHVKYSAEQFSPEQAFFGMQHMDEESIQIMLDATPVDGPQPESTPTKDIFARDPSPPGAFKESPDFESEARPVFASTLTTASPRQGTPIHSRAVTPLETVKDAIPSAQSTAPPLETPLTKENDYLNQSDSCEAPRIELPTLRTALAPPSLTTSENGLNTPVTDIEYESSDGFGATNAGEQSCESPREGQVSPRTFQPGRNSSWTDYSIGTGDEYSEQEDFSQSYVQTTSDPEKKPMPPPKGLVLSPIVPPKPDGYSPLPSPRFISSPHRYGSPSSQRLPTLSTGQGIGLDFTEESPTYGTATIPVFPPYSPPPPPDQGQLSPGATSRSPPPSLYNRRPPSSLFNTSQTGTGNNAESRRASEDVGSPRASISTPRSSTQVSFDETLTETLTNTRSSTIDVSSTERLEGPLSSERPALKIPLHRTQTEQEKAAAEETTKRLFQRRMVIKELIDTESVYLKDMNVVEEIYKGTAEACPKLDAGDVKAIFRNTDEIVAFSTKFLDELKTAACSIYSPRTKPRQAKTPNGTRPGAPTSTDDRLSTATTLTNESDELKDRKTFIGATFGKHLNKMQGIYTEYLRNSELANTRLTVLQGDGAVKVWLSECNLVAKDLTMAWDLDALLVKPVQRITRYQLLLNQIKQNTPPDHPDFEALEVARAELSVLLKHIDDLKKRIHMVGKIVGRKRKESDVRSGIAKAFGRRPTADKLTTNVNRPHDDEVYLKLHEKFGDDYLRLQVVLRDVEFYTRQVSTYVNDFLRYLSSMELVMRMSATNYPEIESKWARFNMSMRDMGSVVLEDHVSAVRKRVIEPFEKVIQLYSPPGLAMKKRNKRRLDYEKSLIMKSQGKKMDDKLVEMVAQYEALNETLKLELPKLSALTETIGNVCLIQLVQVQAQWWRIWQDKVRSVLEDNRIPKDLEDIVDMFQRDYKYSEARVQQLGIVNGTFDSGGSVLTRGSQSTQDDESLKTKGRPPNLSTRSRGMSLGSDKSPVLPTPDFVNRNSGGFLFSPIMATTPNVPQFAYSNHSRAGSGSPATPDPTYGSRHHLPRPGTGRSFTSDAGMRASNDYNNQYRRESGSTSYSASHHVDGPPMSTRPLSGVFRSAMPVEDSYDSRRSSRASSRERGGSNGYNILYLAASLFEFNISATKSEAGYPYLTYQAGEIFDVIGEKGELWLAKNQDDPAEEVGWIWSKHFARLA